MARGQAVNQELSDIVNELWKLDVNRLKPGTDYSVSLQGRAGYVAPGSSESRDRACAPLFSCVNEDKLKNIKTFSYFIKLLDNYEPSTGIPETITGEELEENSLFLDAVLETKVMKRAHEYLVQKRHSPEDLKKFKSQLNDIWFRLYNRERGVGQDSCGFEHVFVGETKNGKEITGFHNWVQFYLQEKLNNVDYKGYKDQDKYTPMADEHVLNLQFSWKGLVKPIGTSFIGVSPEFEVAVFTIVFLMSNEKVTKTVVRLNEYELELVVYRHGNCIGTSYPKLLSRVGRRP